MSKARHLTHRWQRMEAGSTAPLALRAVATGALAVGAFALGALTVGAVAVGALAIGRLAVGRARIRKLEIDELSVRRLVVTEELRAPQALGSEAGPQQASDQGVPLSSPSR